MTFNYQPMTFKAKMPSLVRNKEKQSPRTTDYGHYLRQWCRILKILGIASENRREHLQSRKTTWNMWLQRQQTIGEASAMM